MLLSLLCAFACLNQCSASHSRGLCPIIVGWQRHIVARGGDTAEAWSGCCLENMAHEALEWLTTNPNLIPLVSHHIVFHLKKVQNNQNSRVLKIHLFYMSLWLMFRNIRVSIHYVNYVRETNRNVLSVGRSRLKNKNSAGGSNTEDSYSLNRTDICQKYEGAGAGVNIWFKTSDSKSLDNLAKSFLNWEYTQRLHGHVHSIHLDLRVIF